jgi:membrane protein DedA with SNARE-associated domain
VLTAPGPLRSIRLDATERGEQTFKRVEAVAILLTPSWVAGIFHARPGIYNLINALSAAVWAVTIGVGGYYVGPLVVEVVDDLGTVGLILAIAIVGVALATTLIRRQRGAERRTAERESA